MSFEFMLSRCSSEIAGPLSGRYAIPKAAQLELRTPNRRAPLRGEGHAKR